MKIFALIPDEFLEEAKECNFYFDTKCCLGLNDKKEITLIVTVKDADGKVINGTQYIADMTLYEDFSVGTKEIETAVPNTLINNCVADAAE